jgi:hypothetical protein
MKGSERFDKKQVEHVDPSFTIFNSKAEFWELLSVSLYLTPHQISIGHEITLISSIPHASMVFTKPIGTFEDTPDYNTNRFSNSEPS